MANISIKRFKKCLCNELVNKYHVSETEAFDAVKKSYLSKALKQDPDYIEHDTIGYWATFVYKEWNNKKAERQKILIM